MNNDLEWLGETVRGRKVLCDRGHSVTVIISAKLNVTPWCKNNC